MVLRGIRLESTVSFPSSRGPQEEGMTEGPFSRPFRPLDFILGYREVD